MFPSRFHLYLIFAIVFLLMHGVGIAMEDRPYFYNALVSSSVVLIVLFILERWYSKTSGNAFRNLGFKEINFRGIFPGLLISGCLLLVYPLLGFLFNTNISLTHLWLPNLAGLFLTGGLMEESFFRGFIFRHFREKWTFRKATGHSMLLFAIAHLLLFVYQEWPVALLSTILSVAISLPFAWLFEKGDNTVWSPALVHTTIRTIGMVVTVPEKHYMPVVSLWMLASMVVPYIVLLFYKDFRNCLKRPKV